MKLWMTILLATLVVGCGGESNNATSSAGIASTADETICSCTNNPPMTDTRANACSALIESMSPEDAAQKVFECRHPTSLPDDGPDLCFCLKSMITDPEIAKACEALIDEDWTPADLNDRMLECAR